MNNEKDKDSLLEDTLAKAYHGTPMIKPDEQNRYLGTFKERVIVFLLKEELEDLEKLQEVEKFMNNTQADIILINSKYIKELSKYIKIAEGKGLNYRVVSRKEGSTDVILVIASNKALRNDNN